MKGTVLFFFAMAVVVLGQESGSSQRTIPLRDGYVILGAGGILRQAADPNCWEFLPREPLTDGRGRIEAQTPIMVLPSATLEKILSVMVSEDKELGVWLMARVTLYQKKNYLFPVNFVPTKTKKQPTATVLTPGIADPNDNSILPKEILERLKPEVVFDLTKMPKLLEAQRDVALVNRTGFVVGHGSDRTFVLDGFGLQIEGLSFKLLPNTILQQTEQSTDDSAGRIRFRISGIVTRFRGQDYLLLQRAARTYTHGNFSR
ncbi:MAG: hypothetical protein JXA82_09515 [Sedimentisphaerales bacterium]|nr:hypothetical protein [Sedimentisphaerales bacterium]